MPEVNLGLTEDNGNRLVSNENRLLLDTESVSESNGNRFHSYPPLSHPLADAQGILSHPPAVGEGLPTASPDKASQLASDHFVETPSVRPGRTRNPVASTPVVELQEHHTTIPVHTAPPAQLREMPSAAQPKPRIVNRSRGHRFEQTYNGQKCIACKMSRATHERDRRSCPNEKMDIDAVDAAKPEEKKQSPKVDFTNPVRPHDWTKDKKVCSVCQTTLDEARYEGTACTQAEGAGA